MPEFSQQAMQYLWGGLAALLSGGFLTALGSLWTIKNKGPLERQNLIVSGAESAVASLDRSLEAETRRADRAEARVVQLEEAMAAKDARIEALERRLDDFQAALDVARAELHSIRTSSEELREGSS